jgi:hypothetical protein
VHYGATGLLRLKVFPGETPGLYRAGVYDWFDRGPRYESASELLLVDARTEAAREADVMRATRAELSDGDTDRVRKK